MRRPTRGSPFRLQRHGAPSVLLLLCLALLPASASADPLRLVADPWPPYVDPNLPHGGLAVGIVTEALARAGHTTALTVTQWDDVMAGIGEGRYDVVVGAWYSEARERTLGFSEPYLFNELRLAKLRDASFSFEDILARRRPELTMGLVRNYAYGEALAPLEGYARSNESFLTQSLLRLIEAKVDFVVADDRAVYYHLRALLPAQEERVEVAAEPLARIGLRMAVAQAHPKRQQILADFSHALGEMKRDGALDALLAEFEKDAATSALRSPSAP